LPVIDEALERPVLSRKTDYLAVTKGPLVTSLMAGMESVRSLAFAWEKND
jgi:tRNA A37 threonylcarbamoyltransferase TsaD